MPDRRVCAVLLCLGAGLLSACGDPAGAPCAFEGSGFHASDNCRHRCLEHRTIHCPDGTAIVSPKVCSGPRQCSPGSCPVGQLCYHVQDSFSAESYCIDAGFCGLPDAAARSAWELDSKRIADALLAEQAAKRLQRASTVVPNAD
ncbi:MAG: hypothetical protein AAGI15_08050 [Pseudomonadota bacterium]